MEPSLDKKEIAAKLTTLRTERFGVISASEFGRRTGVSKGSVKPIEDGRQWVRFDTLEKWVTGCGKTLSEFFMEDKETNRPHLYFDQNHRDYYILLNRILQHGSPKQVTSLRNQLEALAESIQIPTAKSKARR